MKKDLTVLIARMIEYLPEELSEVKELLIPLTSTENLDEMKRDPAKLLELSNKFTALAINTTSRPYGKRAVGQAEIIQALKSSNSSMPGMMGELDIFDYMGTNRLIEIVETCECTTCVNAKGNFFQEKFSHGSIK